MSNFMTLEAFLAIHNDKVMNFKTSTHDYIVRFRMVNGYL